MADRETWDEYDPLENLTKKDIVEIKGFGDVHTLKRADVVDKMVIDFLKGGTNQRTTFPGYVRKIISFSDKLFQNADPFHSRQDNTERMNFFGMLKGIKERKMAYVEVPSFFPSNSTNLISDFNRFMPMLRVDITDSEKRFGRKIVLNEVVIVTFKDLNNYYDGIVLKLPKGDVPVLLETDLIDQGKKKG